jgi:hypothetical protein
MHSAHTSHASHSRNHPHVTRTPPPPSPAPQTVQLTTFAVNYVGHPFNESLGDNKGMRTSLTWSSLFLLVLVLETVPALNER